jgi:nucleoside-diphosphate-sugar epimerase
VQVSSYWAYLPLQRLPLDESHPREGGPEWARLRREAEDVLLAAGAAVLHLPDFFGPQVHTSSLQQALGQALAGKPMDFLGSRDTERDYVYVPDAMRMALALSERDEAFGQRWIVPGSGAISASALADLCADLLGHDVKVRAAKPWMLRLLALLDADLRAFLPMAPQYAQPIRYDAAKLARLLGELRPTPYREALAATFAWLRAERGRS